VTYGPPATTGGMAPLISSSADGLHYVGHQHGPTLIYSLFEGPHPLFLSFLFLFVDKLLSRHAG
jgi:hypothetical protein